MRYLRKLFKWVKDLFVKKEEEFEKEIPVEDAFAMWREQQRKQNGS